MRTSSPVPHRLRQAGAASTPLELLFDLVFVVAVATAVSELAHGIAQGHVTRSLTSFAMVFFAIWWAWMNFTWFASSYHVDAGWFRFLVMAQMAGVLILAAGTPQAFEHFDWTAGTLGYVVMRIAAIVQWTHSGRSDPERRTTARRYATGIGTVQVLWLARLALPHDLAWTLPSFAALAVLEMAVPAWAEAGSRTQWHPHHIAERYALFTLILLGELVAVAVTGVRVELSEAGLTPGLAGVSAASLVLLLALWWLYFLSPMAEHLTANRELAFRWGYGHATLFAALAVLAAGLELSLQVSHQNHLSLGLVSVGYLVAAPVVTFIVGLWALEAIALRSVRYWNWVLAASLALAATPWLALTQLRAAGVVGAIALVTALFTWRVAALKVKFDETQTSATPQS
ncbi:MAG: low temperature requirement protein A [Bifidobacteriaceae bacterium]|jgi:low temperature requirement protein LtrA|nr:low temperature requirement protein A [Bifidobacteriaceae bacterium]